MAVRKLSHSLSMDTVWSELIYTEARLQADAHASDLAAEVAGLIARVETVRHEQRQCWRAEIQAQAAVDAADDGLDDTVGSFARTLLNVVRDDRKDPRYLRYFSHKPSSVIRMGLESEVKKVEGWPASLAGESDAGLQAEGRALGKAVDAGKAALQGRSQAATARADQRVRGVVRLIDDVNGARLWLWGELAKRASRRSLQRDWPDRFFQHEHALRPAADGAGESAAAPVDAAAAGGEA